jgi:hypothetical protein
MGHPTVKEFCNPWEEGQKYSLNITFPLCNCTMISNSQSTILLFLFFLELMNDNSEQEVLEIKFKLSVMQLYNEMLHCC